MDLLDADPKRSASHRNMADHLAGPFAGGAVDTAIPLRPVANGIWGARVDWTTRQPLLLAGLIAPLAEVGLKLTVTAMTGGASPVAVQFAPFSEAGAFLPVWPAGLPIADPEAHPPFDVQVVASDAVANNSVGALVELRLVEGVLGRLLYIVGAEKARVRQQARQLLALKKFGFAFDEQNPAHKAMGPALDRLGADLGVPRNTSALTWDAQNGQPTSVSGREPNEPYRQRLKIYRPFLLATRRRTEAALSLAGGAPIGLTEPNAEFSVAIQLVASPDDAPRTAFLAWLRGAHLLQPGQKLPATRLLPGEVRGRQQAILDRLALAYDFPPSASVAPLLAEALDRAGRCRAALGVTRKWKVLRAQDDGGGSRYELGLGVDVEIPPAAELDLLAQNLQQRQFAAGADVGSLTLLGGLAPAPAKADPIGRWLLAGCGLKTVHQSAADRYYLSHFPAFGLVLRPAAGTSPSPAPSPTPSPTPSPGPRPSPAAGAATPSVASAFAGLSASAEVSVTPAAGSSHDPSTSLAFEARLEAPADPGQNALLWYGLRDAAADARAISLPAWTELAPRDAAAAIAAATVPQAAALLAFQAAGLRGPATQSDLASTVIALAAFPAELWTVLKLDPALATGILTNDAGAVQKLGQLVGFLKLRELGSALPLVRAGDALLVVGAAGLPGAAVMLNARRLAFRWYALPVLRDLQHDHAGSANYRLLSATGAAGQEKWLRCNKCRCLARAGSASPGPCAAGGTHDADAGTAYALTADAPGAGQDNWRWCKKCQALAFAGNPSPGACPAGGEHNHEGSRNYRLDFDQGSGQDNWRWCNKCQVLAFAGTPSPGPCPARATGSLDRQIGPRNSYQPPPWSTLAAVVAVTLARRDQDDPRGRVPPYSLRVDLPDGALLDLAAFERVMNLLERAVPLGVVIDTQAMRERHVDPTGQGKAVPLTGRLAHSFREFQQRRHLGAINSDR